MTVSISAWGQFGLVTSHIYISSDVLTTVSIILLLLYMYRLDNWWLDFGNHSIFFGFLEYFRTSIARDLEN